MTDAPARMSVNDPFIDWDLATKVKVTLNGKTIEQCLEYDTVKGYVVVRKRDRDGSLLIREGQLQSERLYGEVVVSLGDPIHVD